MKERVDREMRGEKSERQRAYGVANRWSILPMHETVIDRRCIFRTQALLKFSFLKDRGECRHKTKQHTHNGADNKQP